MRIKSVPSAYWVTLTMSAGPPTYLDGRIIDDPTGARITELRRALQRLDPSASLVWAQEPNEDPGQWHVHAVVLADIPGDALRTKLAARWRARVDVALISPATAETTAHYFLKNAANDPAAHRQLNAKKLVRKSGAFWGHHDDGTEATHRELRRAYVAARDAGDL